MSDAGIATIVTGLITVTTMIIGFLTLWLKLRYGVERKIDVNTAMTAEQGSISTTNARAAVHAAKAAASATEALATQLNGKLDERITLIVKSHVEPIVAIIREHSAQDDKNMHEIRTALGELRDKTTANIR